MFVCQSGGFLYKIDHDFGHKTCLNIHVQEGKVNNNSVMLWNLVMISRTHINTLIHIHHPRSAWILHWHLTCMLSAPHSTKPTLLCNDISAHHRTIPQILLYKYTQNNKTKAGCTQHTSVLLNLVTSICLWGTCESASWGGEHCMN